MTRPPGPSVTRRPLPALVFLLALTLLAALVWWRVLARDDGHAAANPTCTPSTAASQPKQLPQQAAITVQVLNSTKRSLIATKAQRALVKDGFQAPAAAANDGKTYPGYSGRVKGVAEIRYGPAGKAGAQLLAYYFPGATMVTTDEKDATVLVSLGEKYKHPASAKHVAATLKADGITLIRVAGSLPGTGSSAQACQTPAPAVTVTRTAGPSGSPSGS